MTSTPTPEPGERVWRCLLDGSCTATSTDDIGYHVACGWVTLPAPSTPGEGTPARDVAEAVDSCPGCEAPLWPDNLTSCWNCGQALIDYGPKFRTPPPGEGTGRPDTAQLREAATNAEVGGIVDETIITAAADWIDAQPAPLTPTPCPYVVTGDEGTSYCALAEHGPTPAPQRDRDALYDDLLTAARKGCFCEPHSKPCPDHMMYADGLEAGLRAATSPGTGDNP